MTSPKQTNHELFRETGRFRPIQYSPLPTPTPPPKTPIKLAFISSIFPLSSVSIGKQPQQQSKWWRLYFEEPLSSLPKETVSTIILKSFEVLHQNLQLEDSKNA